jgi:predicted lactoylglutathione lyase
MATNRKMFVNLPVRDLQKSMRFFSTLGFEFNKQFTNENGACMMISGEAFVMLLSEPFFKTFTKQALCDTKTSTEGLFALSCENRAEVDDLVKKARLELLRPRRPSLGSAVDGSVSDSAGADRRHAPVPVEATPRERFRYLCTSAHRRT